MSKKELDTKPQVIGSIIISKTDDPAENLKVVFNGDWLHKEILSLGLTVTKAFKQHMAEIKKQLDNEKETRDEN